MNTYHLEILRSALEAREREVTEYQVNIDNFVLAIEKCKADPELDDFRANLASLLQANRLEQKKARVMLEVIRQQLENSDAVLQA